MDSQTENTDEALVTVVNVEKEVGGQPDLQHIAHIFDCRVADFDAEFGVIQTAGWPRPTYMIITSWKTATAMIALHPIKVEQISRNHKSWPT